MSKYVIELGEDVQFVQSINVTQYGNAYTITEHVDKLEELNSDYINEHFGDLQDTAYQRGLDDAWEAARKLFSSMADSDIEKAFPIEWNNGGFKALINLHPQEAIAKLKAYEQKRADKPIIGEVIERYLNGKRDGVGVFLGEDGDYWNCLFWTGAIFGTFAYPSNQFKRTGNVCDITKILEAMKND